MRITMEKLITIPVWFILFIIIASSVFSIVIYKTTVLHGIKMYCINNFTTAHGSAYLDIYKKLK